MTELGTLLNTVKNPTIPCPACGRIEQMQVYERAVRWYCGRVRELPRIALTGRRSEWQKQVAA